MVHIHEIRFDNLQRKLQFCVLQFHDQRQITQVNLSEALPMPILQSIANQAMVYGLQLQQVLP